MTAPLHGWTGGGDWEPPPPPPKRDDDDNDNDDDDDRDDGDGGDDRRADASGVILGRFDPPHRGHQYLFDVADSWVSHLTIVVVEGGGGEVELGQRVAWVRRMAPRAQVHGVAAGDTAEQLARIRELLPVEATYQFSSERIDGAPERGIARRHVAVDPDRLTVPISSSLIRADPLEHWAQLPEVVRPYAVRRVRIVGAESTGKTTMARALAQRFDTRWVPEYARIAAESRGGDLTGRDLGDVSRGQIACEDAAALGANRVLFCDTDLLTVSLWADRLGAPPRTWWPAEIARRPYDLTLFLQADVPFVGAPERDDPLGRRRLQDVLAASLAESGAEPVIVGGDWARRLEIADAAVDATLARPGLAAARGHHGRTAKR